MATTYDIGKGAVGTAAGTVLGPAGQVAGLVSGLSSHRRNTNQDVAMDRMLQQMQDLKNQASQGAITGDQYAKQINDLVKQAWDYRNQFGSKGSQYATRANQQWNNIVQAGFATQSGKAMTDVDPFAGTPYAGSDQLQSILQSYKAAGKGPADAANDIKSYANTFQQMFNSSVGRDPTASEYNQFLSNVVQNDQPWSKPLDQTQLRQETSGLLSQYYQGEAQKVAQQKLQDTANAAVAPGSAFDQWQKSYMQSANDLESNLLDYQSRLMEKIRPQLITSLQKQGLLDSGALNQAFAGATSDMTTTAGQLSAAAKAQAAQDIANQRMNVMSQPTNYQTQQAFGAVPSLMGTGQNALNQVYQNYANLNLAGVQNQYANDMYNKQMSSQPSLLQQYGGMMLGGIAGGAGQGLGYSMFR